MVLVEVKVPDIGDFKDVAIIEVLVKVGDTIKAEQSLLTVESDKASMEIPSSHAGVVRELKVALGDKVNEGTVVVMLEVAGAAATAPAPVALAAPSVPVSVAMTSAPEGLPASLEQHLDEVERGILVRALQEYGFNRTAAGQRLGLTLRQIRYRMARLGITAHECVDDSAGE